MYWKPRIGLTYSWGFCGWFLITAVFPHAVLVVLHQFGQHRKLRSHQLCHKGWSSACARVAQRLQCLGLTNVVYFRLEISCMCVPILSIYLCRWDVYGTFPVVHVCITGQTDHYFVCACEGEGNAEGSSQLNVAEAWSESSSELEGWAGVVRRNRWCFFLNLQCFLPCPHPLWTDKMIYLFQRLL